MAAKRKTSPAPAAAQSSSSDESSSDSEQFVTLRNPPLAETPKRTERDDDESDSDSGSESDPEPPIKTLKTPQKPSESEDSSEEEEEEQEQVTKVKSSAKTPKTSQKSSESEDSSEEEEEEQEEMKKLKSPAKTLKTSQKPSESEDSSEEDEEQEQVEKPKSPAKEPESPPDKKKQKLSTPDQSPSKKSSIIHRIWSPEDEISLLQALSEYQVKNGKLPPKKDYASFILGISGSIGFPVTEKQLFNKIRQLRFNYGQKKKKGSDIKFSQPHEKAVFDLCTKLYEDGSNASKKGASQETNCDAETKSVGKRKKGITEPGSLMAENGGTATIDNEVANVGAANGCVVNGTVANGGDVTRSQETNHAAVKKSGGKRKKGTNGGTATIDDGVANVVAANGGDVARSNVVAANGGVVNGAVSNGGDVARSNFYLEGLIKDMISTEKCLSWLPTVEDVVARIGESRVHDLEAKTMTLRIDAIKLRAREEKLRAELFDILADEMVDD